MIFVGIDPAASTGLVAIEDNGASSFSMEGAADEVCDFLRMHAEALTNDARWGGSGALIRMAVELPFVGDNRKGAVKQAITAGRLAQAACAAYGVRWDDVLWLEPQRWRREIGCPLGRQEAKDWCWKRASEAGLEVETKRGRKLYDAAEAYGIALAARSMQRRTDAASEPG